MPPMYWSMVYTAATCILFILRQINRRVGYGRKRTFEWADEVVVITGGSSGLGLLIAEVYGMRGVSVAVLDVKEPEGGEARNVEYYKCDIGDKKQVAEAAKQIQEDVSGKQAFLRNRVANGNSWVPRRF